MKKNSISDFVLSIKNSSLRLSHHEIMDDLIASIKIEMSSQKSISDEDIKKIEKLLASAKYIKNIPK